MHPGRPVASSSRSWAVGELLVVVDSRDTPSRYVGDVKVRQIIEELEDDGWVLVRQSGSHAQFRHPDKAGTVTVPGRLGDDLARGTVGSIVRQAGLPRRQR